MSQIIKLSDKAADRIKSILSNDKTSLGVRIGSKEWGMCWDVICNGVCKISKPK